MNAGGTSGAFRSEQRYRWMFTFSVSGDLRFISHHDTLRLFQRAFARAAVPVRYTEGFNPRPRISIPLPRPVGVASDEDALVVETTGPVDAGSTIEALNRQAPPDLRLLGIRPLAPGERPSPASVRYRLAPDEPPVADLESRVRLLMATDVVPFERIHPKKATRRIVNLRPYIRELVVDGGDVLMTLAVTGNGTAKPSEIAALLGYDSGAVNHRVRRLEIQWQ